ncbi:AP endonuclease [Rickenella mellea]|uniref:Apurinic-apyrimidinic endonuclease 1 n=1 Tax=Rickenella mellea TaxID=50990 RepID=A0A4Y7PUQ4_9AGAM|nr:AP endonuclease [Rickenella mellea]
MALVVRRSARISSSIQVTQIPSTSSTTTLAEEITKPRKRKRSTLSIADEPVLDGVASASSSSIISPGVQTAEKHIAVKTRKRNHVRPVTASLEDYPSRAVNDWKIGAHVSAAGGVENAIHNAAAVGANAFALFLKSQRKWLSPDVTDESVKLFKSRMQEFNYSPRHVLPHGSYLINLGNPDLEKREKSFECFLDDLQRCEKLGLMLYNFHPGSTVGAATRDESIKHIADCLNRAHKLTTNVVTVIENMAGAGNIIGSKFTEIASIIEQVEDKARVGVCLDTCHMFAAGYDIRTKEVYESSISLFDEEIGLSYLRGMHLNDSKTPLGSKKDRHENIGLGHIDLRAFSHIVTDPRLKDIPLILETPIFDSPSVWKKEIEILNRLSLIRSADVEVGVEDAGDGESDVVFEEMVREVKEEVAVFAAKKEAKAGKAGKKKRKKAEREDEGEDGSCDEPL